MGVCSRLHCRRWLSTSESQARPPYHWIGNAIRQSTAYNKRLNIVQAAMPAHLESEAEFDEHVSLLASLPVTIEAITTRENMKQYCLIATSFATKQKLFRDNVAQNAILRLKEQVEAFLGLIDQAESGALLMGNEQLAQLKKLLGHMIGLMPKQLVFATAAARVNKLSSIMGAANIKNGLLDKAIAALALPEGRPIAELNRAMEVASGVDMTEHSAMVSKICNNFYVTGGEGLLRALPVAIRVSCTDSLGELCKNSGLDQWAALWAYMELSIAGLSCIDKWQKLAPSVEECLSHADGEATFAELRNILRGLKSKDAAVLPGEGTLRAFMPGTQEQLTAIVEEIAAIATSEADVWLVKCATILRDKVGASDDGMFTVKWAVGKSTFEELETAVKALDTTNLKEKIQRFDEASFIWFR